jgi:hypothetical protein
MEYVIRINYAELYNEELKDLLASSSTKPLKIIEDPQIGPMIQGITEPFFTSARDVRALLEEGEQRRHFGETNMNAHSSRSHVIVRLHIESRRVAVRSSNPLRTSWGKDKPNCVSTLNLVDLAGSERANKAGTSGETLKEGSFINKSLLTLGTVIANLSEGKTQHIPYRNSKLTRLLATALGGNAKTCMITCISPASGNLGESLNTLRFATRAKRIVNHVQKNEILDMKSLTAKLTMQATELEQLRQLLELSRQLGFNPEDDDSNESVRDKAVYASRKWRCLKFMLIHGAKIITGLRGAGMSHMAKNVIGNMRQSVKGQKDVRVFIEEISNIISTYLSKDRRLLETIHDVEVQNEAEAIVSQQEDMENLMDRLSPAEGIEQSKSREDDIFDLLERGGEDIREQMEVAGFETENVRGLALGHIAMLQRKLRDGADHERSLRKNIEDHMNSILDHRETIKSMKATETALHKQIEDLKTQRASDASAFTEQITQLNKKLSQLESATTDKDSSLAERSKLLMTKEGENELLRSQIEKLQEDLSQTLASKRSVEDELVRSRNEDRVKLEKLRKNMHDILVNQGDAGKKMEMLTKENNDLQTKLQVLEDELDASLKMNDQLNMEIVQLRGTITTLRDGEKAFIEKSTVIQTENGNLLMNLRDARLEITQLTASMSISEQNHLKGKQTLEIRISELEQDIVAQEMKARILQEKYETKMQELNFDISGKSVEIQSLLDQLENKSSLFARQEQSFGADISRLEKKLTAQGKLCEELQRENTNTAIQIHQINHKHSEEVRSLKTKIADLQSTIDGIQNYVETQEKELLEAQQQDMYDDDGMTYYSSYYSDSPYSRKNSMLSVTSQSDLLSRKQSYISQFYYSDNGGDFRSSFISPPGLHNRSPSSLFSPKGQSFVSPNGRDSILGDDLDITYVDDLEEDNDDGRSVGSQSRLVASAPSAALGVSSGQNYASRQQTSGTGGLSGNGKEKGRRSVAFRDMSPLSPVSSGLRDGRMSPLSQKIDDAEQPTKETLSRLIDGMNLATVLMEHSLKEDQMIRERLLSEGVRHDARHHDDFVTVTRLQDRTQYLEESKQQLQTAVQFCDGKIEQLQQRCNNLEQENSLLNENYHRSVGQEKLQELTIKKLDQQNKEIKARLDAVRSELQRQTQSFTELRLENLKLEGKVEEYDEKVNAAETRLLLARQEISILTAEKDELIRRFLPNVAGRIP